MEIAQSRVVGQEAIAAQFDGCGEMDRIDQSVDSAAGIAIMTTNASRSVVDVRNQASCPKILVVPGTPYLTPKKQVWCFRICCCLIQSIYEMKIESTFWNQDEPEPEPLPKVIHVTPI
jgi:hypothetical protein